MSNKLYNEQSVQDIADAIRSVSGSVSTYTIAEMSAAVAGISTGLDWAQLNYNTSGPNKGTPAEVVNGFEYAKDIIDSYTSTSSYVQDKQLLFWPNIDITGRYNYQQLFDRASLLHCPALTLGETEPTGTITTNYMFKETLIESATINSVNDAAVAYNSTFIDCKRLKTVQINTPASATEHMFEGCASLTTVNLFDTSAVTNARYMFKGCASLVTAPLYDLSACTLLNELFNGCTALVNIPLYDASACTNFTSFVNNCLQLSDTSLDNILQMCIDATAYTGTKKLSQLGVNSAYDTRIAALPHYQDFLDAGWIIR